MLEWLHLMIKQKGSHVCCTYIYFLTLMQTDLYLLFWHSCKSVTCFYSDANPCHVYVFDSRVRQIYVYRLTLWKHDICPLFLSSWKPDLCPCILLSYTLRLFSRTDRTIFMFHVQNEPMPRFLTLVLVGPVTTFRQTGPMPIYYLSNR